MVALPVGIEDGLPVGVQIIGKRWQEDQLLKVAGRLEKVLGGFVPPPALCRRDLQGRLQSPIRALITGIPLIKVRGRLKSPLQSLQLPSEPHLNSFSFSHRVIRPMEPSSALDLQPFQRG